MASDQHKETQDQINRTGINIENKAGRNATVIAPTLINSTVSGPVNINYISQPADTSKTSEKQRKQDDLMLQKFLESHKANMKKKVERIFDVKKKEENLQDIYTELFITEGDIEGVNKEHEITQIDEASKSKKQQDRQIYCNDIFRSLRQNMNKNTNEKKTDESDSLEINEKKKTVLTKGIAGIGKTISLHKFILDWAEGKANQDIDAMFLFPFREINLIKVEKINFHQFLSKLYPDLEQKGKNVYKKNLAFIFDGLDESRLSLNFDSNMLTSVEESSSVDELFINLIRGHLLPSSLIWITSRPAAANQIPPEFVGLFTEVRGFKDRQKEEYFRKKIKDETQASKIISHIKKSRMLFIMCHIPVFCWFAATVLQNILMKNNEEDIPTTLTEMYIHFILIQMNVKSQKYDGKTERNSRKILVSNKPVVLKLAKLAFEQLKKENIIFYEEDLQECGIDVNEDTLDYTGMIAEILKEEDGLYEMKVFRFVHLSVQEFLAALHVFMSYLNNNLDEIQYFFKESLQTVDLQGLLVNAVNKAMESKRGHLDLFLRFLMGISLESNQKLLLGLFSKTENSTESITKVKAHIKDKLQKHDIPAEASVNLYYCLLELKDKSLYEEIQRVMSSAKHSGGGRLSGSMCSVLNYILLSSDEVMDEFIPKRYTSYENCRRLVPAVRCCRRADLSFCDLTAECCESLSSTLQSSNSHLIDLDLAKNQIQYSGVKQICDGLKSSDCKLQILCLSFCDLTAECCESLSSALQSSNSLIDLDLSYNKQIQDSGVKQICDGLKSSDCKLQILSLSDCDLTAECCESLSSALQSSNSLIDLDLRFNKQIQDSGVKQICDGLKSSDCKLQILSLSWCGVTDEGFCYLASALRSNPSSHLRELELWDNHPGDSGVEQLSDLLKDPHCTLETLKM